ncbi:MAG: hypothetical protein IH962_03505 [Chloroflexi bacterium]|nr:hypothetical protein [Chloroflexota bacterium]
MDYLAENVTWLPESAMASFAGEVNWRPVLGHVEEEIKEIDGLLARGNAAAARKKYLRLWQVVDRMASGNGIMFKSILTARIAADLAEFRLDGGNRGVYTGEGTLLAVPETLPRKLDSSLAAAISLEYVSMKRLMDRDNQTLCGPNVVCPINAPWPFGDRVKTVRVIHGRWYALLNLSRVPLSDNEEGLAAYRRAEAKEKSFSILKNLGGHFFFRNFGASPEPAIFIYLPQLAKSRLAVLGYVINAAESGDYSAVPIDPLTGDLFTVNDQGDFIEIRSEYIRDGELVVDYKIPKGQR